LSYEKSRRNEWTTPDEDMIECFNKTNNEVAEDE
jgi:hypothetical protein